MKTNAIAAIVMFAAATSFADDEPAYQNPLEKPKPKTVQSTGYQNPLDRPAYGQTKTKEEKRAEKYSPSAPPTAAAIARSQAEVASQQNSVSRAHQQTLQVEISALRDRERALSKQYATKVPSMTNNQLYNYNREQTAIRDQIVAKEQELKQLQRIEAESQRNH